MKRTRALLRQVLPVILMTVIWEPLLLAAGPATQPMLPAPLPIHTANFLDIRYGDAPGPSNLMDIFLPDHADRSLPLVIWIHGGGWANGDKKGCPAQIMTSYGFAVASINYRLSPQATYPAQIQDCKGAIRFLRAHAGQYHIDPDRIGVWGASAGGHLAALIGTSAGSNELEGTVGGNEDRSSRVQAVCDWFGPTDLTQFAAQAQAAGIIHQTAGPPLIMALFGGSLTEKKNLVTQANPIAFIPKENGRQLPPFLIMHGDKDNMVPVGQSELLNDALKTAGTSVDFRVIKGAGHGTGFGTADIANTVLSFFQTALMSEHAAP